MSTTNDLPPTERCLGVLGGMGPQATVDFLAKLVQVTPVQREQDHLHVLVDSNPKVADRNLALAGQGPSPAPQLVAMAQRLERAGAQLLVMACNTAHAFEREIRAAVAVPFVGIVDEAADACARLGARQVGLLAAPGCLAAGLYQRALAQRGMAPVLLAPAEQAAFDALLYRIKLGEPRAALSPAMQALAHGLIARGADTVLAACTEVPLVLSQAEVERALIDATHNLAERCVLYARGQLSLPLASSERPTLSSS